MPELQPSAPPTLFSDEQLAALESRCHTVLTAAGQIVAVVHDAWHLVQELKSARLREEQLRTAAEQHAASGQSALAFAQAQQDRVTEIAATANEHYSARQSLENENAALVTEIGRLRGELAKQQEPAMPCPFAAVPETDPLQPELLSLGMIADVKPEPTE